MSRVDPERARQRLSEERSRVEEALASIRSEPASDEPQDFGDGGQQLEQAERDEALREELDEILTAIERAERRLEEGTYGVSIATGKPIPDERLEAVPWAERTVEEEGRR
jgi:DnaK suppressor protein